MNIQVRDVTGRTYFRKVKPAPVLVRCLGPSDKEHFFLSRDVGVRICGRCRETQRRMECGRAAVQIVRFVAEG